MGSEEISFTRWQTGNYQKSIQLQTLRNGEFRKNTTEMV
jgi:hypothetical protein